MPAEVRGSDRSESKGGSNSVVESQPSKLLVAGSIPVSRSILCDASPHRVRADVAQLAERVLGKDEVTGSIPVIGSIRLGTAYLAHGKPSRRSTRGEMACPSERR